MVPDHANELMEKVILNCRFTNSVKVGSVMLPYIERTEQYFTYTVGDYNLGKEESAMVTGFNGVGYNLIYPNNDHTSIVEVDDGGTITKYLQLQLKESDKASNVIGFHNTINIPLNTNYSTKRTFMSEFAQSFGASLGNHTLPILSGLAVGFITQNPYLGVAVAGFLEGGGTVTRYIAQNRVGDDHLLPPPENKNRSIKLYKNNEIPVLNERTGEMDLVRYDDLNVPGDDNIWLDDEEPIWSGTAEAFIDLLDELEYTMTTNNDTFTFDIDQYVSDETVAMAPYGEPRPIGMKKIIIHTNIPPTIPVMDNQNPVELQSNGTYGIQYNDSSNELSIIPANRNTSVIGSFEVNVPSIPTQTKSVEYTSSGSYTVTPDSGYNLSL